MMSGKTVLVTGATGGIGKATAIGLARLGARVGITGRDMARAEAAAADISAASNNAAVDAFAADLSSQAEVRRLACDVLYRYLADFVQCLVLTRIEASLRMISAAETVPWRN